MVDKNVKGYFLCGKFCKQEKMSVKSGSSGLSSRVTLSGRNSVRSASPDAGGYKSDCVNIFIITDDKQRQENQSAAVSYEAKQVDDKFKEILQKRKGKNRFLGSKRSQ